MDHVRVTLPGGGELYFSGGEVEAAPPKKSTQRAAAFGQGGRQKMFAEQAANPQKPGRTAHDVEGAAPGSKRAAGGGPTPRAIGGESRRARPGETGT